MEMTKNAIGIKNYKTYSNTYNDLISFGFIKEIQKSKNQYSSCIIALVKNTNAHTKALSKALSKHSQKHYQSIVGIDKHITSEPNNLTTVPVVDILEEELKRVTHTALSYSLREWWKYKK